MRPTIAVLKTSSGWLRLWLCLTALSTPPVIAAAALGHWDSATDRITAGAAMLLLIAIAFFVLTLAIRAYLTLVLWVAEGFDAETRQALRLHVRPPIRVALATLAVALCVLLLRDQILPRDRRSTAGGWCHVTTPLSASNSNFRLPILRRPL